MKKYLITYVSTYIWYAWNIHNTGVKYVTSALQSFLTALSILNSYRDTMFEIVVHGTNLIKLWKFWYPVCLKVINTEESSFVTDAQLVHKITNKQKYKVHIPCLKELCVRQIWQITKMLRFFISKTNQYRGLKLHDQA